MKCLSIRLPAMFRMNQMLPMKLWIASGDDATNTNRIKYSYDGINWITPGFAAGFQYANMIMFDGTKFYRLEVCFGSTQAFDQFILDLSVNATYFGGGVIVSDIELIDPEYINTAYDRTVASDVKYRFVINASKF